MKKVLTLVFIMILSTAFGQNLKKKVYISQQKAIMRKAYAWQDGQVYKNALYQLIVFSDHPEVYKDSLANFYLRTGEFYSLIPLTDELLKAHPGEVKYLQMQAIAYENLGDIKKAIDLYEQLFKKNPDDVSAGFRLAWNQYKLKRIDEAYATLISLKDKKFPEKILVQMPAGKNRMQGVPLKAAYYNLLGLVSYDLHNLKVAAGYFEQALKEFPNFFSAKQNKAAVELMLQKLDKSNKKETKTKGVKTN